MVSEEVERIGVLERIWLATKRRWHVFSGQGAGYQSGSRPSLGWRPAGNYQSYMIRFWRTNATMPWRAAVVDPRQNAVHYFADREALYAFLNAQIDNHEP